MIILKLLLVLPLSIFRHAPVDHVNHHPQPRETQEQSTSAYLAWARARTGAQFPCLRQLWLRESRWQSDARNSSSGAYGIPQALPGARMESAGPDWATNGYTQMRWGLEYISKTYGTPCAALAHSNLQGWY